MQAQKKVQEGSFTTAVVTCQSDFFPFVYFKRDIFQDAAVIKRNRNVFKFNFRNLRLWQKVGIIIFLF